MTLKTLAIGLVLAIVFSGSPAVAVEEPPFKTVLSEGAFEVRDYPSLIVAEVTVTGEQRPAANKGFRLLAGYIFGGNRRRQSIAMTSPVAQEPAGEKIAMTAPVSHVQEAGNWIVRFTMPSAYALESLPEPNDRKVRLRRLPATRYAVLRFSGLASPSDVATKSAALLAGVRAHHFHASGPVTLAQYNPPWTPWFLRRNEVMIQLIP